jgi:hypothetical protein
MMTLAERRDAFARVYAKWPAAWPWLVQEGDRDVLYATWIIGNDYRNRSRYYGAYPHGFLDRVLALFPDAGGAGGDVELPLFAKLTPKRRRRQPGTIIPPMPHVLHAFSGSLPKSDAYMRCDSHQPAEFRCSVYALPTRAPAPWFRLVLADPPYTPKDAKSYGTPGVDRRRALAALAAVTERGGFLTWLDTCWPMFNKRQWTTVGRITVIRSTNHRVRLLSIFQREPQGVSND